MLQLTGIGGLIIVVITHICEKLDILPFMGWGQRHSAGHYLDLCGAILGVVLVPAGYLVRWCEGAHNRRANE